MKRAPAAITVLVGVVATSGVLAGCANKSARSQEFYTPADGVNAQAGGIAIRNVVAVQGEDGLSLLATFVPRDAADELVGVTIGGEDAVLSPQGVELPQGVPVTVGVGDISAEVEGLEVVLGASTEVAFTFAQESGTSVQAIVLPVAVVYGTDTPTSDPTATPAATPTG